MITHDESSWNLASRGSITIIFDALSDGYHPVAQFQAHLFKHRPVFAKNRENDETSMFVKSIQEGSRGIRESPGMSWNVPFVSWVIFVTFRKSMIFVHFHDFLSMKDSSREFPM